MAKKKFKTHKDFHGQEIQIGDQVVGLVSGCRELTTFDVIGSSDKMIRVRRPGKNRFNKFHSAKSVYPDLVVKKLFMKDSESWDAEKCNVVMDHAETFLFSDTCDELIFQNFCHLATNCMIFGPDKERLRATKLLKKAADYTQTRHLKRWRDEKLFNILKGV